MKRVLSWVLAVLLVLTFEIPHASADNEKISGDFSYRIKGNGTAIITGYHGKENEDIYIPKMIDGYTVTEIGEEIFDKEIDSMIHIGFKATSLLIPDTVVSIGAKAFMCMQLELSSITIPASVQYIGPGAFSGIYGLSQFVVSEENPVYATVEGVLYNKVEKELVACPRSIADNKGSIPEGIKSIGDYAFYGCGQPNPISRLNFPQTLERIGAYAFSYSDIVWGCEIPAALNSLGEGAFADCEIYNGNLDFSKSKITIIPSYAFKNCEVTRGQFIFPPQLVTIENNAFESTTMEVEKVLAFPSTLTTIGDEAFYKCDCFINAFYSSDKKVIFAEGLQSIGNSAFAEFDFFNILTLPSSLRTIGDNICDRTQVRIDAPAGSYAALWASENGYMMKSNGEEDTSWLNN